MEFRLPVGSTQQAPSSVVSASTVYSENFTDFCQSLQASGGIVLQISLVSYPFTSCPLSHLFINH